MKSKTEAYCDGDSPLEGGPRVEDIGRGIMKNEKAKHTPGPWYVAKTGGIYAGNAYLFPAAIAKAKGE